MTKKIPSSPLSIHSEKTTAFLEKFIFEELKSRNFSKAVIGLSGGIDSATTTLLTTRAIGKENVFCLVLPYKKLGEKDKNDAVKFAKNLKINFEVIEISPMVDTYFKIIKEKKVDPIRLGNKMARERMSILYDFSKKLNALVIGTSNRTELILGYGTIYGDIACAFMPLGGLYKTQVYELAKFLGVPKNIIKKDPSAGLWKGQTDEKELGISYEKADKILYLMIDKKLPLTEITKHGFPAKLIEKINLRISANIFKLKPPVVPVMPLNLFVEKR